MNGYKLKILTRVNLYLLLLWFYNQNLGIFGQIANNYFFIKFEFLVFLALFYRLKLIIPFSISLNAPIKSY